MNNTISKIANDIYKLIDLAMRNKSKLYNRFDILDYKIIQDISFSIDSCYLHIVGDRELKRVSIKEMSDFVKSLEHEGENHTKIFRVKDTIISGEYEYFDVFDVKNKEGTTDRYIWVEPPYGHGYEVVITDPSNPIQIFTGKYNGSGEPIYVDYKSKEDYIPQ